MKLQILGLYSLLLSTLAVFGIGCEPYHHHGVGIELDIHSKDHSDHHKKGENRDDHHDDNHDDRGDNHDDNH